MKNPIELEIGGQYLSRDGYVWVIVGHSSSMDMTGEDIFLGKPRDLPGDMLYKFKPNGRWWGSISDTIFDLIQEL